MSGVRRSWCVSALDDRSSLRRTAWHRRKLMKLHEHGLALLNHHSPQQNFDRAAQHLCFPHGPPYLQRVAISSTRRWSFNAAQRDRAVFFASSTFKLFQGVQLDRFCSHLFFSVNVNFAVLSDHGSDGEVRTFVACARCYSITMSLRALFSMKFGYHLE